MWDLKSGTFVAAAAVITLLTIARQQRSEISKIRNSAQKKNASRRVEKVAGDLWLVEVGMPLNGDLFVFGLCLGRLKSVFVER